MKIAYISYLPLADVDFSYLHEAQKIMDITCYMLVLPNHIKRSVINFHTRIESSGVYETTEFPELSCYKDYLNLNRIKVINIANTRNWQIEAFRVLNSLTEKWKSEYDLVHITRFPQWFEFPFFKLRNKIVLSVHDPIPHSGQSIIKKKIHDGVRWITCRLLSNFIIFNEAQREDFQNLYKLHNKNIIISRLSCYTCLQPIARNLSAPLSNNYILFLGRIAQYKGLQYLLPAFKMVHQQHPDVNLIIAGSGKFSFDIAEYQNLNYIEFRNRFIPDTELIELMKGCMFMICPYTDATQSGVIMSAFAFNVPILATNVGGLPEMVKDDVFGRIIKEKSENSIVDGISNMLSDSERLQIYSNNIRREYNEGVLSWKMISAKLKTDYESCIC